jgi:hypothetical protein
LLDTCGVRWGIKVPHCKYKRCEVSSRSIDEVRNFSCFTARVEEPLSTADVLPYRKFVSTSFYKEWATPQGLVDSLHTMLDKSATGGAAFVVFRHARDGLVDGETRRRVRLIVPHVRRAALIGKVIEQKTAEAATLADTLDGISAGMLLLDASGRIVRANAAGQAMLAKAEVLHAAGGRLAPTIGRAIGCCPTSSPAPRMAMWRSGSRA